MADLKALLHALKTAERPRLWVLIDAAGLELGREGIQEDSFEQLDCLFTGDLAIELRDVAPYLGLLALQREDAAATLHALSAQASAVMLLDPPGKDLTFPEVHRHLRKFNVVYGPDGAPLFFRYYDGRVLPSVLESLEATQAEAFFGPFRSLVVAGDDGDAIKLELINGQLAKTTNIT